MTPSGDLPPIAIAEHEDFIIELLGLTPMRFRMAIDTTNPDRFAKFRLALDIAEKILRLPNPCDVRASLEFEAFEWDLP